MIIKRSKVDVNAPGTLSLVGGKVELSDEEPSIKGNILEEILVRERIAEEVDIKESL